jgi:hypothetical protein
MMTLIAAIVFNIQWPDPFSGDNTPKAASIQMAVQGMLDPNAIAEKISKGFEASTGCQPSEFTWLILRSQKL